jgi:hypothetical protein
VIKASAPAIVKDNYTMINAKKRNITYVATQRTIETQTSSGKKMNIVFRVSNDGVAFRYEFPEKSTDVKKISAEATSFHFMREQGHGCNQKPKHNQGLSIPIHLTKPITRWTLQQAHRLRRKTGGCILLYLNTTIHGC